MRYFKYKLLLNIRGVAYNIDRIEFIIFSLHFTLNICRDKGNPANKTNRKMISPHKINTIRMDGNCPVIKTAYLSDTA